MSAPDPGFIHVPDGEIGRSGYPHEPMYWQFRAATEEDRQWLYTLYEATLRDYIEQVWGWDEAWQRRHFQEDFDPCRIRIVELEREPVGMLRVEQRQGEIYLREIQILPEHQGRGIGSQVLGALLQEAVRQQKAVTLQVFRINPARRLYERLGFRITTETPTHYRMRWDPDQGTATA